MIVHQRHLPAVVARDAGAAAARSGEPAAGPRSAACACRRRSFAIRRWRSPGCWSNKIGGPSVKPYQPAGLWRELQLLRGLRAGPRRRPLPPQPLHLLEAHRAAAHDGQLRRAEPRELQSSAQNATNTPLQALDLMNDVTYVEAARVLAAAHDEGGRREPSTRASASPSVSPRPGYPPRRNGRSCSRRSRGSSRASPRVRTTRASYVSQGEYPRDETLDRARTGRLHDVASLILNLEPDCDEGADRELTHDPAEPPHVSDPPHVLGPRRHRCRRCRAGQPARAEPARAGRRGATCGHRRAAWLAAPAGRRPSVSSTCSRAAVRRRWTCSTTSRSWKSGTAPTCRTRSVRGSGSRR